MDAIHRFERAGLGKAPFRVVGCERRVGPLPVLGKDGHPTGQVVGAPGQPMGCCQYCFQGIADCWTIRSADGKTFVVGSDCVMKTGDAGLRKVVSKAKSEARRTSELTRIARFAVELVENQALRAALASTPSPNERAAEEFGDTMLVWAEWMFAHAGRAGRLKVIRRVEKLLK